MKIRNLVACSALAGTLLLSPISSATLIGISSDFPNGGIYSINPTTGAATLLSSLAGGTSLVGATFLGGTLYGSDLLPAGGGEFFTGSIDPLSGAAAFFSNQDGSSNWHGLASNEAAGLLYAIDINDGNILKSVDLGGCGHGHRCR